MSLSPLSLDIFPGLSTPAADALRAHSTRRELAEGATLFREGDDAHGIFLILAGEVRVIRTARGRRHVLHTERAGGTLGEAPFFDRKPYPATAVAASAVRLLHVDRPALDRALRVTPDVAWFFLGRLAGRVRGFVERIDRLATADVGTRLAAYLLEQAEGTETSIITATQGSLAEELGTVREVVARALRALRAEQVIRTAGRGRVEVVDRIALRAAANAHPARQS